MKVKIEIDTSDITRFTSYKEDSEIAKEFLEHASEKDLINEVISRNLTIDLLDELTEHERALIFSHYGYEEKEG